MERREFDQEELAAMRLCAPSIPLYPSTTFAVHRTPSQSTRDRNGGSTHRSRQLQMKATWISNIRRQGKHSGLTTEKIRHVWQQRWLQWHQALCNYALLHGIGCFQNM